VVSTSRISAPLDALQARLGHRFAQPLMLQRALTHRSFGAAHNERLEFLGDAVLNLAVSTLLYARYAASAEGDLTRVRAHLVREDSLHRVALDLGLPQVLRLSEGEARGGGAQRPSILADAVEALIGAVHLDAGFDAAQALVQRLFGAQIAASEAAQWSKDAKTELQETLQARRLPVPGYRIRATRGQAHEQVFEVECEVPALGLVEAAEGRSRRAAEQEAAQRMLVRLKVRPAAETEPAVGSAGHGR
jgi:ribonuclease-3